MPELPEVETIRRVLEKKIKNCLIRRIEVRHPKPVGNQSESALAKRLTGRRIVAVERRAKYLLFRLDPGWLMIHLGMTGQVFALRAPQTVVSDLPELPDKHTHFILTLSRDWRLMYRDIRRFGRIRVLNDAGLRELEERLGPEPLSKDFTAGYLQKALAGRRAPVKALLLNQKIIAGLGNIYVDEALFRSRIAPQTPGDRLSGRAIRPLVDAIREVLREAIKHRGTTLSDYYDPESRRGGFQDRLRVYGRAGEPCRICSQPIRRGVVAQRGTHWCPKCQPYG